MHLTRRYFLQTTGLLAAYVGVTPSNLFAAAGRPGLRPRPVAPGRTLVIIFLRGGADGLSLVVPHADPHYASLRRQTRIPAPGAERGAIDLDGFFSLHPRLGALAPHFDSGLAVAAHAVGYDRNTRSHFEEQDVWETGVIGNTINSDGWVNRHLATSEGHGPLRAVAVGDSLPRILHGKAPAFAVRGLEDLTMRGDESQRARVAKALEHAYCCGDRPSASPAAQDARDLLSQTAGVTLEGVRLLQDMLKADYAPASPYPPSDLARQLMQVARLIKADVGLEVAEVDFGGWDTHAQQSNGPDGQFGNLAQTLGDAVAAFLDDLGDRAEHTAVVTLTDFGRTCEENGTGGTDHGWANCMLLAGGPVRRANLAAAAAGTPRKVVTAWPGLAPDQLHEGRDLLHTTDFRDVLAELVRVHLGNPNLEAILPHHAFKPVGLVQA